MFRYLNLKVPQLSKFEWHPFTISSAPTDEFVTLHIRGAGDWTNALLKLVERCNASEHGPKHAEAGGAGEGETSRIVGALPYPAMEVSSRPG